MNKKYQLAVLFTTLSALSFVVIATAQTIHSKPDVRTAPNAVAASYSLGWAQANEDGFGHITNSNVTSLEVFDGNLYAGASNWWYGGQVWRSTDGSTWAQVSDLGFTSTYTNTNAALIDMIEFEGQLYVDTGWSWSGAPGQIWRSPNGEDWEQVEGAGFGDPANSAIGTFGIFSNTLYVATQSSDGLEIWRSSTGNSGDWTQVVNDGNGNANNTIGSSLLEFEGSLYAAVENGTDGAEIWRTEDGLSWTTVITGGFDSINNTQTGGLAEFDGNLYVGTLNYSTGGQIWRTSNGTDWDQVEGYGFDDLNNFKVESLVVFDGILYAATDNEVSGVEVWRSSDGEAWTKVNEDGFGDYNNINTLWSSGTVVFDDNLFMGTRNDETGGEVWTMVPSLLDMVALTAGEYHACRLTEEGGVMCWGNNYDGQLGDGTVTERSTPVDVLGLSSGVSAVSAGRSHTCALTTGGGVKCWGNNGSGQLGNGTYEGSLTPVDVSGLTSGVTAIAAGGYHTCALTTGGGVKCWGYNSSGQLGNDTYDNSPVPVDVNGLTSGVEAIDAGDFHTCALITGGGVQCWGYNGSGQLGDGTTDNSPIPVDASGLANGMEAVSAGGYHTCALTDAEGVKCWGYNYSGQLGDGTTITSTTAVDVIGLTGDIGAISAGGYHTCALTKWGGVKCWGYNYNDQLGNGSGSSSSTPVDVIGMGSGIDAVAAGRYHTCASIARDWATCWGNNGYGQRGDGTSWIPFSGRLVLDGTDKYAYAPYQSELDLRGGDYTVEMWLKFNDSIGSTVYNMNPVYQRKGFGSLGFTREIDYTHIPPLTRCRLGIRIDNVTWSVNTSCLGNSWTHWAVVNDSAAGEIRVYINGQYFGSWGADDFATIPEYLVINYSGSNLLKYADEIRISDVARYSSSFTYPSAPFDCDEYTRALWHFDEPEGSTVFHDSCGTEDNYLTGYNGAHTEGVNPNPPIPLTPTPTGTTTPSPTPTGSITPTPTSTPTPTGSITPTPTSTPTPTGSITPTPTSTPTPTGSITPTPTSTSTPTGSITPTPTSTGEVGNKIYLPLIMRSP